MPTERKILLALFAIALGIRVLYGAVLAEQTDAAAQTITRELAYARQIASGVRWIAEPISPQSPGYPVVLAAFYLLAAKQLWLVAFLQAVVGALTVVIIYRLGRQLLGVPFATVAALWFAFHARHIYVCSVFRRDVLSVFLLALVVFFLVRPFVKMRYAAVSGIIYAALIHTDPQFILLLPLFLVFVFFKSRYRLFSLQYLFVFLGIILVASLPWTIRNYAVYDQPLPIGLEARRFLRPVKLAATEPWMELSGATTRIVTASRAGVVRRNALEFWRVARFHADPEAEETPASGATARRPAEPAWSARHNIASMVNIGVLLPFFLAGIVLAVRDRQRAALMLAATVAAYFLMRAYLGGGEHTRLPVDPFIVLFAFYGIAGIAIRVMRYRPEGPVRSFRREA